MRWLAATFILIGILALLCVGGFVLYGVAYSQGEAAGYNAGYATSFNNTFQKGFRLLGRITETLFGLGVNRGYVVPHLMNSLTRKPGRVSRSSPRRCVD